MKKCGKCGEVKELTAFNKNKARKDGYQNYCKECLAVSKAAWSARNPTYNRDWHRSNYDSQLEKRRAYFQQYYLDNKEVIDKKNRDHYCRNKVSYRVRQANRRAFEIKASPGWSDAEKVKAYYDVCAFFNEVNGYTKYHVDHIVPLKGRSVCGLHVHNNLQIITAYENRSKSNRFNID